MRSSAGGARVGDDHRDGGILTGPTVLEGLLCDGHGRGYLVGANSYDDRLVVQDDARELADARRDWGEETTSDRWNQIGGILVGSSRIYYHYQDVVGLGSLQHFEEDIGVHRRCCFHRTVRDDWLHRRMALAVRHRHDEKTCQPSLPVSWSDLASGLGTPCLALPADYFACLRE